MIEHYTEDNDSDEPPLTRRKVASNRRMTVLSWIVVIALTTLMTWLFCYAVLAMDAADRLRY